MLVAVKGQVLLGLLVLVTHDAVGGGELRHHKTAAAKVANKAPKDSVGNASHRRKHGRGTNFDSAYRDGRRHACASRSNPFSRIVVKLVHLFIVNGEMERTAGAVSN